ncbi:MAG: bifunctional phosphopantothenoylcysteine decarboxylase/phosphopantothenate--cysteine ligase CoaBC [Longimonas sp.]|uniref:bifunctional phosphopantothenoylcysteine decarboxylase/phosphopantothenate--cysteine ligase CoaBC n=1 Tax=Longimonas sp. TaxID=2039626 RepID=UPI0039747DF0
MPSSDAPSTAALNGCNLILGVTGSIAAYKAAPLVRLFKKSGAQVRVLMTESAERFIPALTLGTLSGETVHTEIFPENDPDSWTEHVSLGLWADAFVIAPATAQTVAKLAHGFSDNMLTATALSARCPILVCPAMDLDMYQHPATQANFEELRSFGYDVMPAEHGELASGLEGPGRLPELPAIAARVAALIDDSALDPGQSSSLPPDALSGQQVLVTAGPTEEPIDPVRMLTNPSTGTMGFALAEAASAHGATVTLVSGPTHLDTPPGVTRVDVRTAAEMHDAVQSRRHQADLVFMAAAVADYTPAHPADTKQKKGNGPLTLTLERTPDILHTLGQHKRDGQVLVGFALETDNARANAQSKRTRKNLDWIALNNASEAGSGFGTGTNALTLFGPNDHEHCIATAPKPEVAKSLIAHVVRHTPALQPPAAP